MPEGNEIITAGITINLEGTSGQVVGQSRETENLLKSILEEMRAMNTNQMTESRKKESGFFGDAAGGLGLKSMLSTAGGALIGLLGGGFMAANNEAFTAGGPQQFPFTFEKAITPEGKDVVIKVDKKTGEILEILTEREAKEKGILDETGKMTKKFGKMNREAQNIYDTLAKSRDKYLLTDEFMNVMNVEQAKQVQIDKEITRLKQKIAENLAREARDRYSPASAEAARNDAVRNALMQGNQVRSIEDYTFTPGINIISTLNNQRAISNLNSSSNQNQQSSGSIFMDIIQGGLFR